MKFTVLSRLLFIVYFIEVGLMLIIVPWSSFWDHNYFAASWPPLHGIIRNNFLRGAVSGLGLVNVCAGADIRDDLAYALDVLRQSVAVGEHPFWKRLISARKNPLRQAGLEGFDTLFLLLTHQLSLREAERRVSRRTGLQARALICPHAEMGMDVDKPFQLEALRGVLERKAATPAG